MPQSSSRRPAGCSPNHRGRCKVQRGIGHGFGSFSRPSADGFRGRDRIDRRRRTGLCWRPNPRTPRKGHDEHFAGQTCLDYGRSSGIGSATARVLSAAGAEVVLSARSGGQDRGTSRGDQEPRWGRPRPSAGRHGQGGERADRPRVGRRGGILVLVNNAGVMPLSPFWRTGWTSGADHRREHQGCAVHDTF